MSSRLSSLSTATDASVSIPWGSFFRCPPAEKEAPNTIPSDSISSKRAESLSGEELEKRKKIREAVAAHVEKHGYQEPGKNYVRLPFRQRLLSDGQRLAVFQTGLEKEGEARTCITYGNKRYSVDGEGRILNCLGSRDFPIWDCLRKGLHGTVCEVPCLNDKEYAQCIRRYSLFGLSNYARRSVEELLEKSLGRSPEEIRKAAAVAAAEKNLEY